MGFRLFSRSRSVAKKAQTRQAGKFVESLEGRTLMTATPVAVVAIVADDRGEVQVRFNKALSTTSASAANLKKSLRIFAPGTDGNLNTVDDVQVAPSSIVYDTGTRTVTIKAAALPINTNYRVKLYASGVTDSDNLHLDGEYTGTYPSGDGTEGGNFEFRTKRDSSNLPTVRLEYNVGLITVRLDKANAPITVNNFISYVDAGRLDGTIIHRNGRTDPTGEIDIIQGGGFKSIGGAHIATDSPITLEGGIGNTRGTIAMARTNVANSATSEYFFNVQTNSFLNPSVPGLDGYAAFGTITSGLNLMDGIFNLNSVNAGGAFQSVPQVSGQNIVLVRAAVQMKIASL